MQTKCLKFCIETKHCISSFESQFNSINQIFIFILILKIDFLKLFLSFERKPHFDQDKIFALFQKNFFDTLFLVNIFLVISSEVL